MQFRWSEIGLKTGGQVECGGCLGWFGGGGGGW